MVHNFFRRFILLTIIHVVSISSGPSVLGSSDLCIECRTLAETSINEENGDTSTDFNNNSIIGCDDVDKAMLGYGGAGLNYSQEKKKIFFDCLKQNDSAFIDINSGIIDGDIQSMIVISSTIFALSPKKIYKYDRTTLSELQSIEYERGKDSFLYIAPYDIQGTSFPVIRVCIKATAPLQCIQFYGNLSNYSSIDLTNMSNITMESELRILEKYIERGLDPVIRNPDFIKYIDSRATFLKFILSNNTKDVIKNSVEPFFPFSQLIIAEGSDYPRKIRILHPKYVNEISINCSKFNESINYDLYTTLNYIFNPSTEIMSIFLRNNKEWKVYVASVKLSDIEYAFQYRLYQFVSERLCYFELIPGIQNATSGIRLNDDTFVISNNRAMPLIIEEGKEPVQVLWNPAVNLGSNHGEIIFITSNDDDSEVYGYSGNKILKMTRRKLSSTLKNNDYNLLNVTISSIFLFIAAIIVAVAIKKCQYPSTFDKIGRALCDRRKRASDQRPLVPHRSQTSLVPLYEMSDITIIANLKQGHFGEVQRGILRADDRRLDVAVKSLKQPDPIALQREAEIIISLDHPNVLLLVGILIDPNTEQPKALLFPFMEYGYLLEYVYLHRHSPLVQLLKFSIDVSSGMEYLASKHIVHRDLAARNCFVDEFLSVRVGDFGLSRVIEEGNTVHKLTGNSFIPVNHAPDVVETGFNEATDVWSFGRLLFEIFSFGTCSMGDLHHFPDIIVKLMTACQSERQMDRPTFARIHQILTSIDEKEFRLKMSTVPTVNGYVRIQQV